MQVTDRVSLLGQAPRSTRPVGARIMAVAAAQPEGSITGTELGSAFGRTADWIRARTGIQRLRRISGAERLIDLAVTAGAEAISRAGLIPAQIDLVIAATCTTRAARSGRNWSTG